MPVIFGFFVAGCCVFKYLCLCVCECACVCEGVCTQVCVCWCVSYHSTFASSEGQKYTAASWDKQEQIRLWAPHPWGSIAFVYQPPPPPTWRCEILKRGTLNLCSVHISKSGKGEGGKKSGYQSCRVLWINRHSTWPFKFFFHSPVLLSRCMRVRADR